MKQTVSSAASRLLRLCVVQLDIIPQARQSTLWAPAEPRLASLTSAHGSVDRRQLSVAELFAASVGEPDVYRDVQGIMAKAVAARLEEVLGYVAEHRADVVVLPEYAVPVACLPQLVRHSDGRAIVAGLGRIRNDQDAAKLREAGVVESDAMELVGRNVSVLIHDHHIWMNTKRHLADGEDAAEGSGRAIVETLRFGGRDVRLGVAVCLDYLRGDEEIRNQGAEIVCIPSYTSNAGPFRPDAPRDFIRLFANCAQHGGSAIMIPGLMDAALRDNLGVRPVAAGYEALMLVEFDRFPSRPTPYARPQNRLVLRSEIIEDGSKSHALLGRLDSMLDRFTGAERPSVAELAADADRLGPLLGPFAESLNELRRSMDQQVQDVRLIEVAQTHLVVPTGNRPSEIRERQTRYVWRQLRTLEWDETRPHLGAALDLYRPRNASKRASFEPDIYIEKVLRRTRAGPDDSLPPVPDRYALEDSLRDAADEDLTKWIDDIVRLWRRQADEGTANLAAVCTSFLRADDQLRNRVDYSDPQWWRDQIRTAGPAEPTSPPGTHPAPENPARPLPMARPVSPAELPRSAQNPALADIRDGKDVPLQTSGSTAPRAGEEKPRPPKTPWPLTEPRTSPRPKREEEPGAAPQPSSQPAADPSALTEQQLAPKLSPPTGLVSETTDNGVILRWQASPDTPDGVTFTVERSGGQDVEPGDGATSGTYIEDPDPPAGRRLVYRVRAEHRATNARSDDASPVTVVYTPPVRDLTARQVLDGGVHGQWRGHRNISGARAWRTPEGAPADQASGVAVEASADGFTDQQPPVGRHLYIVVPLYEDPDSRAVHEGPRASVSVTVLNPPPPPQLELYGWEHKSARVNLRWGELPAGVSLLLRRAPVEPTGSPGDMLMIEEAVEVGRPVTNGAGLTGTTGTLTLPAGRWALVPFAVAGSRAVRGRCLNIDIVPPVFSAEAVRNGPDVLVSWIWPEGLRLVQIVWRADGVDLAREVTYHEFQRLGGVAFHHSKAAEVLISGIVRRAAEVLESVPVTLEVPAQPPTLTFQVHRLPPWLPWSARRSVAFRTDQPCTGVRIEIYLHSPTRTQDAEVVLAVVENLELGPGRSHEVEIRLHRPNAVDRPCYVSCRASTEYGAIRVDHFACTGREVR